jgi:hypothetical protein
VIDFNKEGLLKALDIDKSTYKEYMKNQERNSATSDQKYAIEKYMYKQNWKIDTVDRKFIDKWFRKTYVLRNLKCLIGEELDNFISVDEYNKNKYLEYDKLKQKQRIGIVKQLVEMMGYGLDNIGDVNKLSREVFESNMKKCLDECKIFTDRKMIEPLFGFKVKDVSSVRGFMGFVNSLLKNWGLCVVSKQKTVRDKILKKRLNDNFYYLDYLNQIDLFL